MCFQNVVNGCQGYRPYVHQERMKGTHNLKFERKTQLRCLKTAEIMAESDERRAYFFIWEQGKVAFRQIIQLEFDLYVSNLTRENHKKFSEWELLYYNYSNIHTRLSFFDS